MPYQRTDLARNKGAIELLKTDFTHLLMLDIDHVHPSDVVQRLSRWVALDPKKFQVVGGLNFRRSEPHDPCAYIMDDDQNAFAIEWDEKSQLVEVDRMGTGSIMIAREVFEQIEPPWFFNNYDKVFEDKWPGEDIGFSDKVKAAGIKMWCDTTCTSPHITNALVDASSWAKWREKNPDVFPKSVMTFKEEGRNA
jgi:hypothetical protein